MPRFSFSEQALFSMVFVLVLAAIAGLGKLLASFFK